MSLNATENSIDDLEDKPAKDLNRSLRRENSRGSTEHGTIPEEEEEEKIMIFGEGSGNSRRSSIASVKSFTSSRADELIQKAKDSVLLRRRRK